MIIGHDYIPLFVLELFILEAEECDVTQFNQLNLNSSFFHRAINKLINLLIYLQKWKQLLRFGLLCNIKVIEDTVRHNEEISNIFSSWVLCLMMAQTKFSPASCLVKKDN